MLGVDEHVWHHQDRRHRGPRAHRHRGPDTREGASHGPLAGPGSRKVWHRVQELARRARRTVSLRYPDRDAGSPSRDSKNAIDDQLQDATSVLDAFHIVKLAGDALDEVRRRVQQDTLGHRGRKGDPLYQIRLLLHASRHKLTLRQKERLRAAFTADEAHN